MSRAAAELCPSPLTFCLARSCDDPDGNCVLTDYYGHWRGDNATDETVICEKSFQERWPLEQTCGFGLALGKDKPSTSASGSP